MFHYLDELTYMLVPGNEEYHMTHYLDELTYMLVPGNEEYHMTIVHVHVHIHTTDILHCKKQVL